MLPVRRSWFGTWNISFSREAMEMVGIGIRIGEQSVGAGYLKDLADLYTLKKEDLLQLESFAEKKVENVLEAIDASRKQPLSRFIIALGMRGVGEVLVKTILAIHRPGPFEPGIS